MAVIRLAHLKQRKLRLISLRSSSPSRSSAFSVRPIKWTGIGRGEDPETTALRKLTEARFFAIEDLPDEHTAVRTRINMALR